MKNLNALISMALVSQNGNNPYITFCEYIKYCMSVNASDKMTLREIKKAVEKEFGVSLPYNITARCLEQIRNEGVIICEGHQFKRVGKIDVEAFEQARTVYREKENKVIESLIQYVAKFDKVWDVEYAREQLIKVLDKSGLAYDIFVHGQNESNEIVAEELEELLPDEDEVVEDEKTQPLFWDSLFVGKFVKQTLFTESIQKDYLKSVCGGLMLCAGTYQLPDADAEAAVSQIQGTDFFFDTKLLLRFLGCAGEAAVEAAKELVSLVQSQGGKIYYYPQTYEEMDRAFEDAIRCISGGYPLRDDEMRLYAMQVKNSITVLQAKRASLKDELSQSNIYRREHETFSEMARITYAFDKNDLQHYMRGILSWEQQTIENDVWSLWETHMKRNGNYTEYCGTKERLPVFVTSNTKLVGIALGYKAERSEISGIKGWKQNRLPVITDIKLTCRLWSPATQGERLSLLYLSANAVAAQRPTQRYLNTIRDLAVKLADTAPEYSGIPLPAFFDDNITDALLESTKGNEESFNLGNFASSLAELSEWKAKEEEEKTNRALAECNLVLEELKVQTQTIIDGAVEENVDNLGMSGVLLQMILAWPKISMVFFTVISSIVSYLSSNWYVLLAILVPVVLTVAEHFSTSEFVKRFFLKQIFSKVEKRFETRIEDNLKRAEMPYKDIIIQQVKEQTELWKKCADIVGE